MSVTRTQLALALLLAVGAVAVGARACAQPVAEQPRPTPAKPPARTDRYGDPLPEGALVRFGTLRWRTALEIEALTYAPDGKTLAALAKGCLSLFDTATGKLTKQFRPPNTFLGWVAFSPDSKRLVCTCAPRKGGAGKTTVQVWALPDGRQTLEADAGNVQWLGWSAEGQPLALCLGDGAVILRDLASGEEKRFGALGLPAADRSLSACAYAAGGAVLAVADKEGVIHVWDAATGGKRCALQPRGDHVFGLAFSADGRTLVSLTPGGAQVWDTTEGDRRTLVAFSYYYPRTAGGRVDQDLLITGWDVTARKQLFRRRRVADGLGIAVSPDARLLVVDQGEPDPRFRDELIPGRGAMQLEELTSGAHLRTFPIPEGQTWPLAFSPDGRLLASNTFGPAQRDGQVHDDAETLRLWEVATATEVLALPATDNVRVAFSPDGRLLALSAPGQEVLLWDLRRGREWRLLKGFAADLTGLTFSPDGRRLVSGLSDSTLLVWEVGDVAGAGGPAHLDPEGAARAWTELAATAPKAFAARGALLESPETAVPLLKEHLRPAPAVDAREMRRLLADLDSDQFAVREKARKGLEAMGERIAEALRQALADRPSAEVRRQLQAVLEKACAPLSRPETLRAVRAVAVLEDIASPEARQVLETLAGGAPEARLTQEAQAALARLARRAAVKP